MPVAVDVGQRLFVYSPHRLWTVAYFVKTCRLAHCSHSQTSGEHLRYSPHNVAIADRIAEHQLNVGSRILCIPSNSSHIGLSCKKIEKPQRGMIAELATESNSNRFLIFVDIGEPYYIQCHSIRLLLEPLSNYLSKVDQGTKQYIENYVLTYPKRRLIDIGVKSHITIEHNGQWLEAIVSKCDCTLIRVYIPSLNELEWLYRGSLRLQPLFNLLTTSVNDDEPTSKRFAIDLEQQQEHRCTNSCEKGLSITRKCNFLMIPLNYGWKRQVRNDLGTIVYISPCGQPFTDRERLHLYLIQINSCLTMNLFSFEMDCRATQKYNLLNPPIIDIMDYSNELEKLPLSLVNEINNELPTKFDYICTRISSKDEIPINELKDYIEGCTCTDGCLETDKCACWQRTFNSIIKSYYYEDLITNLKELFMKNKIINDNDENDEENMKIFLYKQLSKQNLGYKHGRLLDKIHSGKVSLFLANPLSPDVHTRGH
ncbi:unnamed protein product [Didymodactylos carnosus]|uniref:MBD domain-containing protein n=1 Tax=Didymodactylos carnosus TaxID=1234261 RepID=A0A8S2FCF8_9BILA|nr:unnamed protein product [Didymodactylos carnosus]CAF4220188.1 unnamed protein product [Didymodactylos carnosus]